MRIPRVLRFAVLVAAAAAPVLAEIEGDTWFPIGPAPIDEWYRGGVSGRATAIAVNPLNPDDIWLGTAAGGVWHSRTGGVDWTPMSDREDSLAIGAVALDECVFGECRAIFVGTGENAIRRDTYQGAGLLIGASSPLGGFAWKHLTGDPFDFRGSSIIDLVLDPTTAGAAKRIFIALSSGVTLGAPESTVTAPLPRGGWGLFRSDNRGLTWKKLGVAGSEQVKPTDLEMHPGNPKVLFAGFLGRGVFRSTDGGDTWCPLNAGIPKPPGCPNQQLPGIAALVFDHVEIAIAPSNPRIVYVTLGRCKDPLIQNCGRAMWRSNDGGNAWFELHAGNPTQGQGAQAGYSRYTHALAVDPANHDRLFLGGIGLYRSDTGGAGFLLSHTNLAPPPGTAEVHPDHRAVVFHPTAAGRVYTSGDGGFATSTDGGKTWTPRNDGLQITGFHGIGSSPLTTMVVGSSQDNGVETWDGSPRWKWRPCCGDGGYSFLDLDDVKNVYAGGNFDAPRRSTDSGNSWQTISNGIPGTDPRLLYVPIVQDPTPDGAQEHPLYFGANRLYRSINNGDQWEAVSKVLALGASKEIVTKNTAQGHIAAGIGQNTITAIAVAPSAPSRVYVGYYLGEIFRTQNGPSVNDLWPRIDTAELPNAPVTRIAVHPTQPGTAYATFSGFGTHARVWKTTDGGADWNPVVTGLPAGVPATTIGIEPSVPNRVYVGLDSGPDGASLYRSTNGGANWAPFAKGLPNAPVYEISFDESRGRMYAATHGRGAFVLGKEFMIHFEGWIGDSLSAVPVYGHAFTPGQGPCTLRVLRSDGSVCASGTTDAMGGALRVDAHGRLETSLADKWQGRNVAWACFDGTCLGGVPIADCPPASIDVSCGAQVAAAKVIDPPPLADPPSSSVELDLAGFQGTGTLHLAASVQRRGGAEPLCAVAVPLARGESELAVLTRARDAFAASPACAAKGVRAQLDPGLAGAGEDDFPRAPRLFLEAPGVAGGQLVTGLRTDPGAATGACLRLRDLGVQALNQLQPMKIDLETPPEGAAGGATVRLVEHSPVGTCALTIPTAPGQSGADLAAAFAAAVQAPGVPGPHPDCPADRNPRDITNRGGSLVTVYASFLELCSTDPNVGFDVRPEAL